MKKRIMATMKFFLAGMGVFCVLTGIPKFVLCSKAAEEATSIAETGSIMTAKQEVAMKEAPEEGAATIMTYEKGASVFVTGENGDGWYRVIYQDKEGYVPKDSLRVQEIDVEKLDEEMEAVEQETKFVVESVEKYREETRRSKIWGGVIIILVAGIFAIGIIAGIKSARNEEET